MKSHSQAEVTILSTSSQPGGLDSLRGRDARLFLDDLHEQIETFDPMPWWQGLKQASGSEHVRMIATVRAGDYWDRVVKERASFVRNIGEHGLIDIAVLSEEVTQSQGRPLGLSPEQVVARSEGTIGSLIVDRLSHAERC